MMRERRLVKSATLKPLLLRGGVGVGPIVFRQRGLSGTRPTPLRLASKLPSLATPPLKRRGQARRTHPNFTNFTPVTHGNSPMFSAPDTQKPRLRRGLGEVDEGERGTHRGGAGSGMAASVAGRRDVGNWFWCSDIVRFAPKPKREAQRAFDASHWRVAVATALARSPISGKLSRRILDRSSMLSGMPGGSAS